MLYLRYFLFISALYAQELSFKLPIKIIYKAKTNLIGQLVTNLTAGKFQISGAGVVVGCLRGDKNSEICAKMLGPENKRLNARNAAYVIVAAAIDPYTYSGLPVDILIVPCDTCDLSNGYLLPTELKGLNGIVYATAAGDLPSAVKNKATIPKGGVIVNLSPTVAEAFDGKLHLQLLKPDAANAVRIAKTINANFGNIAHAASPAMVQVKIPSNKSNTEFTEFIAELEATEVEIDCKPTIEIFPDDQTIIISGNIPIDPDDLSILISAFNLNVESDNPAFRASSVNNLIENLTNQGQDIKVIMQILEYLCKYNKIAVDLKIVYGHKVL